MTDRPATAGVVAPVAVTVDLAIFTVRDAELHVLLIERGKEPFLGASALPGGYVRYGETLEQAARRELSEETGVEGDDLHLEQVRAYGDPERDPRGRVITVAYLALGADLPAPRAGTDAQLAEWVTVTDALERRKQLAFDHAAILSEALERARSQLEYTTVATAFCHEPFSVIDLRRVYEAVWGFHLDPSNFRRKVTRAEHFLEPTGERRYPETGRPAALYRRGSAKLLFPPLLRSSDIIKAQSRVELVRSPHPVLASPKVAMAKTEPRSNRSSRP
jgi:8-oxo-dGTP diphosphatase